MKLVYLHQHNNVINLIYFMRLFLSVLLIITAASCKNKEEQAVKEDTTSNGLTAKEISDLKYTDYVLDAKAKELLIDWQRFQELNIQMKYLKQGDLNFFKNEQSEVKVLFDSLKVNIPGAINIKPIISRITVLETKSLKLHSNLSLLNIEKATKLGSVKEVLVAYANLILQINKKIEYDANVYERPLN